MKIKSDDPLVNAIRKYKNQLLKWNSAGFTLMLVL